jgi:hypothetical protein
VMLLETMPLLLTIHFLHLLAKRNVLIPQDLKSFIEPLESFQHRHASLLPEHTRNLSLIGPHFVLFLLVIGIEFAMLVVAHSHRGSLLEKLRIRVHSFLHVKSGRLHEGWGFAGVGACRVSALGVRLTGLIVGDLVARVVWFHQRIGRLRITVWLHVLLGGHVGLRRIDLVVDSLLRCADGRGARVAALLGNLTRHRLLGMTVHDSPSF